MNWKDAIRSGPLSTSQSATLISFIESLTDQQLQWLRGYFTGEGVAQRAAHGRSDAPVMAGEIISLTILYGTQTGNAQTLAGILEKKCRAQGIEVVNQNMATFNTKDLKKVRNLAIIVSTQGVGEPPIEAWEFHDLLQHGKVPSIQHIKYAVLSLGDTSYSQFCQTGKDFDHFLERLRASRLLTRKDCDVDYEDDALSWMEALITRIKSSSSPVYSIVEQSPQKPDDKPEHNRKNPFEGALTNKVNLNGRGSTKETYHIELSLQGSGMRYSPGDSLGVYAENSSILIHTVLKMARLSAYDQVRSHVGEKSLFDALRTDYELTPLTALTLNRYAELTDSQVLRKFLSSPVETERYLYGRDVADLLKEFPFKMDAASLISILRKNTPRLYSIASGPDAHEDEVHLLVSTIRYQSYSRLRGGFCSTFLADRVKENDRFKVFVEQNSRFRLPKDPLTPIIMVGPGTGVAPFRAFLQQRETTGSLGKSWLFFGERNFTTDFLYQTEWQEFLRKGILTNCDVAFSRDTDQKTYVQHRIKERGKEIYQWLQDGAHLYICGDAKRMAKDVDGTLKEVVGLYGEISAEAADEYLKHLRLTERYQVDVY